MSKFKDFIYGYGKSLDLFPNISSTNNDWTMVGEYINIATNKFSEMNNEERKQYRRTIKQNSERK